MDNSMEIVMEVLTKFSDFYTTNGELQKGRRVVCEMEKIEENYYSAYEAAQDYLDSRKDDSSSVTSDIMSIEMLQSMNISDDQETYRKEEMLPSQPRRIQEVQTFDKSGGNYNISPKTTANISLYPDQAANNIELRKNEQPHRPTEPTDIMNSFMTKSEPMFKDHDRYGRSVSESANEPRVNTHPVRHEPRENCVGPSIGQDLWRQLKRVEIPVFSGEKRAYQSWKAAFLACIDSAPATGEYKLLQLRQYLSGEALKVIENLGHSSTAYEAAKERLERKYGGRRRQIAIYLEDLEQFRQIRPGNARDLEEFADLLDIAIINLKEADQNQELGDGSLYTKLQQKLPQPMLARYHRWIFETNTQESVLTLRTWIIQESEFQTIASETVLGFKGNNRNSQTTQQVPKYRHQRTLFGKTRDNSNRNTSVCQVCEKPHRIWACKDFMQKSVPERWKIAKLFELCFRCLGESHYGKGCPRSRQCGINSCRQLHHKLLHQSSRQSEATGEVTRSLSNTAPKAADATELKDGQPRSSILNSVTSGMEGKEPEREITMMIQDECRSDFIALRTVPVMVKNGNRSLKVNALLDDASTKTYINADVAAELGLQGKPESVTVNVLNGQIKTFNTRPVDIKLENLRGDVSISVTAFTASQVTGDMEAINWNKYKGRWPHLRDIEFPCTSTRPFVDVLIGLDCADLHHAIKEIRGRPGEPIARLTPLGWTCIGSPRSNYKPTLQTRFSRTYFVRDWSEIENLNTSIRKFWEIEDTPSSKEPTIVRPEDQSALRKLERSILYENKMYRVGIPWQEDTVILPDNYQMALQRLENTEKRLKRSPNIAAAYQQIIEDYIKKGYVRKVPEHEQLNSKWYLPHFPVLRPDKDTTKTRIVFDASASCRGVSLNDVIHQGPKLQQDLFDVLLRFRRLPVALVCDIAEMYLRIGISPEDQTYHRFLWRGTDHSRKPDVFEFDRVVFGVNSSPFQAQYVLQQHARKFQSDYPMAAATILHSTYMDDSMDSVRNEAEGIRLYKQLSCLLSEAGMYARKWLSNSATVLENVPLQDRKAEVDLDTDKLPCAKTLGVWWKADEDVFTFKENAPEDTMLYTKRNFLKKIATLFDPIGFLAPFTIRAKMLLQDMWTAGLEWDDELTEPLTTSARAWFKELGDLHYLHIPRCLQAISRSVNTMSLHIFVDSSEAAYGAVAYSRCTYDDGSIFSNIVAAKTRVAPTIATSIPRLELMAAIIGVRLASRIAKVLDIHMNSCVFWSDSVNVLWWIRGRSREFKPFVANRVGEIQLNTSPDQWRHIPTALNPADILTRGMHAKELVNCSAWWRGPDFIRQHEQTWPLNKTFEKPTGDIELKRRLTSNQQKLQSQESDIDVEAYFVHLSGIDSFEFPLDPNHFSSWLRLRRVLSWINRFIENCQKLENDRIYGELLSGELKKAENQLIKYAQYVEFPVEWTALSRGRPLPLTSKILGLRPKIDDDGLMRSDGRLHYAKFLPYDVRYPISLPRTSRITKLIVKEFHEKGNHASGTNQTLAALSARYWVISGREVIRGWEKECMECRRRKNKTCQQIMAPLPLSRLQTSLRAFTRSAVDFGGPFITVQGRGKSRQKRYLCLFTCLATRAVHLEIAFGLDTNSFLNAFYRMASRRGLPEEIYSDNATNFKAADRELKALLLQLDEEKIKNSISNKGVVWHFNPPLAPHFGGIHESMIKSAKRAINAILGNADITDEELMTAIIGAEALINSRPLTYQSANPDDDMPLTPNHFLHGQIGGHFAPTSTDDTQYNLQKRWRRIQELVRHFWHRWLREWIPTLNARKKWHQERRDVQVGEIVLVISPDTTRGNWPLGRITEVYPGQDGRVRVAKVQVGEGTLVRSVNKLCPLECDL